MQYSKCLVIRQASSLNEPFNRADDLEQPVCIDGDFVLLWCHRVDQPELVKSFPEPFDMPIKLQTHPDGNIIACPMTGWELRTAGDTALLVVIEYIDAPEQLETGERKQLQTTVLPQQALELAESLQRNARLILTPNSGKPVN